MPPSVPSVGDASEIEVRSQKNADGAANRPAAVAGTANGGLPTAAKSYTMSEVAQHSTKDDAWLVYGDLVLDVTKWVAHHPGGEMTILRFAGMDATDELRAFHDDWVLETKIRPFVVGTVLDKPETSELVRDFRELGEQFEKLGYFHLTPTFYWLKLVWVFGIFVCSLGLLFKTESLAAHAVSAVLLGIFWQQFAFVGHDAGHMRKRAAAADGVDVTGLGSLVTLFNGISVAWWKATHNVHHAVPNTVDCDPDIAHLPVFAVDSRMFGGLFNKYHRRVMEFDWPARNVFVPYQHFWYYPIMCVARFNLYIQSVIFLLSSSKDGHGSLRTRLDTLAFLGFFTWLTLLVASIPTWPERVAYVLLSHAVAGLLNVQITLSHFSREVFDSPDDKQGSERYGGDFYTRNVLSSLDVDCPSFMDWFHGGLQFQTLHHLYPRLARQHLRKTEPLIRSLCRKHSLPYTARSFVACNVEVFEKLRESATKAKVWSPLIIDALNAEG